MLKGIKQPASVSMKWFTSVVVTLSALAMCTGVNAEPRGSRAELLKELDEAFVEIWQQVAPAVVNVDTEREIVLPEVPPIFRDLFEDFGWRLPESRRSVPVMGRGSGFVIDKEGHILTNTHVIQDADKIIVRFGKDEEYDAKVIGKDSLADIALIKIDPPRNIPTVKLADSDTLRVGQLVMAIGNPGGTFERTFTVGHVSGLGRELPRLLPYQNFIQTDAAINPGNSGGPLINVRAEVVGINTAWAQFAENIGFAVPINIAKEIIPDLKAKGKVTRGFLGVIWENLKPGAGKLYGLPDDKGALVQSVSPNSPAEKAGLKTYDVITEVNGQKIDSGENLLRVITRIRPGTTVPVKLFRDKQPKTVRVKLGERPDEIREEEVGRAQPEETLGIEVRDITPELMGRLNLESDRGAVVMDVEPASPAAEEGVRPEDIIVEVNRQPVSNVAEFRKAVESVKPGDWIMLLLRRDEQTRIAHIEKPPSPE